MPEEEEGFTVRDRRRAYADEPAPAPTPAPTPTPQPVIEDVVAADDDIEEEYAEYADSPEMQELPDVRSVLLMFLQELRQLAWIRMGMVANPVTGQIDRDLMQAKIAIDTVAYMASQLEPHIAPEERLPFKAMISDLQVNFVEQSKRP